MPVLPELSPTDAVFLDFDGTLVEIAPRPAEVVVPAALLDLLAHTRAELGGALALVSGRPIADLDALLSELNEPRTVAAAGEHGAEIRSAGAQEIVRESRLPEFVRTAVQDLATELDGTLLELKEASASLHYRTAPQHERAVIAGMQALEGELPGYALLLGKMVAELKPADVDKGVAIRQLSQAAPFVGRRPVFVGDDVTDEPGFVAVNEMGGVSVRVGDVADSHAQYSLGSVADVHKWLARLV